MAIKVNILVDKKINQKQISVAKMKANFFHKYLH